MNQNGANGPDGQDDEFPKHRDEIRSLLSSNSPEQALKKLKALQNEFADRAEFHVLWAEYHRARNQIAKAADAYRRAVELDSGCTDYYISLADTYSRLNKTEATLDILRQGAQNSGDPLRIFRILHDYLAMLGREDEAAALLDEIKERYAGQPELYYKLGEAALGLGLSYTAMDFFRQCLDQGYDRHTLYYYLAEALANCWHVDHAIFFYCKTILSNAEFVGAYRGLHGALLNGKRSADEKILAALQWRKAELSSDLHDRLALRLLSIEAKNHQQAIDQFISSEIKTDDELPVAYYEILGDVLIDLVINKKDHDSYHFKVGESLQKCVARLQELGAMNQAMYFQAWLAYADGRLDVAERLFSSVDEAGSLRVNMRDGLRRGLQCAQEFQSLQGELSFLGKYGMNLTREVSKSKHPPAQGLDGLVERMINTLLRDSRNSVILTGPSGIGKTAAIRQLAWALKRKTCPKPLRGFTIFQVSTSRILAGAKYIGMWQQNLEEVCRQCGTAHKIILYFEDIANIFSAGKVEGDSSRFADMLIPRMEMNRIILLGELDDHRAQRLFREEPQFERVVTEIPVEEPEDDRLIGLLTEISHGLGEARKVQFDSAAVREAADLTRSFIPYRAFPGKAVDLLQKAAELAGPGNKEDPPQLTADDVILAFCDVSGIPAFIIDKSQPLEPDTMRSFFLERILGQEQAIDAILNAVTVFKARLCDQAKPIRSFLFVGPTGVGKTESAKVLSEYLFGSPRKMIRLNMSEFSEANATDKILGSASLPKSKASRFLEDVRTTPFCVVLLDEIEKANSDVLNLLLQLLDEGTLSDVEGKSTYFQSSIIIMTSNLGARYYTSQAIGFGNKEGIHDAQERVLGEVKEFFTPEIYNRFDEVICFQPLSKDVLEIIINREIGKVLERRGLVGTGISVEVDPIVKEYIIDLGYDPRYGARHIKRAVERAITAPLALLLASANLKPGGQIRINIRRGKPVADQVRDIEQDADSKLLSAAQEQILTYLEIPDQGLRRALESLHSRVQSLKARLKYEDVLAEREELQTIMGRPNFWDKPALANQAVQRYAELNRKTERIHRWERLHDSILGTVGAPARKVRGAELSRARSQLMGLMKDLESAEMELLLEGRYDFADAFILLSCSGSGAEYVKWLLELGGVYTNWARRRGYQYLIFGEQPRAKSGGCLLLMHIGGLNCFGLLKNERGVHRKSVLKRSGRSKSKHHFDCTVMVLADVRADDQAQLVMQKLERKLKPPQKGWKIKALSRHLTLTDKVSSLSLDFLTSEAIGEDKKIAADVFSSYVHFQTRHRQNVFGSGNSVWGSLVRTYEFSDTERIIDHKTELVFRKLKDHLAGKIDSLLMERIM